MSKLFSPSNMQKFILMFACLFLTYGLTFGGYMGYDYYAQNRDADRNKVDIEMKPAVATSDEVAVDVGQSSSESGKKKEIVDPMERRFDFASLGDLAELAYGWIYIPDTEIDYCVMRDKVGNGKYIWSDIYGQSSSVGCIFTYDTTDDDMLRVFYGHHLSGPAKMFTELHYYDDEDWANDHKYVYFYYLDRVEKWAVWSPQYVKKNNEVYQYPYYKSEKAYKDLLDNLEDNAPQLYTAAPKSDEELFVLSTCDSSVNGTTGRYIVPLVKKEVKYYDEED